MAGCGPLAAPDSFTIDRLVGLLNTKIRRCGVDPQIILSSHLCYSTSLICSKYCAATLHLSAKVNQQLHSLSWVSMAS